jgi:hypothetical protein
MAAFLYYIPGGASKADLPALGLDHLIGASLNLNPISGGPDNLSGMLMSIGPGKYHAATQTWQQHGKFWLGFETENKPSALDLARPEKIQGHRVTLEEGWEVIVPLVRRIPTGTALPELMVLGADGELVREPLPRFAALSQGAEQIFEVLLMGEGSMEFADVWKIAVAALAVNYRVSAAELSALKVITTANIIQIAEALIDLPTLREAEKAELQKKRPEEESNIKRGEPD